MRNFRFSVVFLFILMVITGLTACGGGGGSDSSSVVVPPPVDTTKAQVVGHIVGSEARVILYNGNNAQALAQADTAGGNFAMTIGSGFGEYYLPVIVKDWGLPTEMAFTYYAYGDGGVFSNMAKPMAGTTISMGDLTLDPGTGQAVSSGKMPAGMVGVSVPVDMRSIGQWAGTLEVTSSTCPPKPGDKGPLSFSIDSIATNAVTITLKGDKPEDNKTLKGTMAGSVMFVSAYVSNLDGTAYTARMRGIVSGLGTKIVAGTLDQVGYNGKCSLSATFEADKQP